MQPSFPLICCRLLENKQRSPDTVSLYNRQPHETFPRKKQNDYNCFLHQSSNCLPSVKGIHGKELVYRLLRMPNQSLLPDTPFSGSTNTDLAVAYYVVCITSWTVQSVSLMSSRTEANVCSLQASAVRMFTAN